MHHVSTADTPELLQWMYANQCFTRSGEACKYVLSQGIAPGNVLHYPLSAAIHVLYSRPFKNAKGIKKIDPAFIPKELMQAHNYLIDGRDKLFAHFDAGKDIQIEGIASFQPALVVEQGGVRAQCLELTASFETLQSIDKLLRFVCIQSGGRIYQVLKRNRDTLPSEPGTYPLKADGLLGAKKHP